MQYTKLWDDAKYYSRKLNRHWPEWSRYKAEGTGEMIIKILEDVDDFGIGKFADIINIGHTPIDMLLS